MRHASVLACIASAASAGPAKKQPPAPPAPAPAPVVEPAGPPKPWAAGVPQEQQDKASALYEEGNQLFAQQAHAPALDKYKAAIALWDHPLIRFNMAVTEIRLERVLDAADDLEKALRYGDQPFTKDNYEKALDYQALLKGRVGYVEASCEQPGAHLLLDGKPWFDCPGKQKVRVLAGEHAVVGEKPGFVTSSQKLVVTGGATATGKLELVSLDSAVVVQYRYRRWIPWSLAGLGGALALAGAGTLLVGNNGISQFEGDYATQCPNGCEPGLTDPAHRSLLDEKNSAQLKQKIGVVMIGAGGAVAITGIVLAILNRPSKVLPNVEIVPHAGGASATIGWSF